jgi:hypothetical protein
LKKRSKKLLLLGTTHVALPSPQPVAPGSKVFLLLFVHKKKPSFLAPQAAGARVNGGKTHQGE